MNAGRRHKTTEHVTEIYVAVFPMPVDDERMMEVILAGCQKHADCPHMMQIRATVETHKEAVKDLVALCDEIVDEQEEVQSYRLLKFDKDGMHILHPADFRTMDPPSVDNGWGHC